MLSLQPVSAFITKPVSSIDKAAAVSAILLLQVLIMRWNVVIGGQLMSKSARGYTEFHPEWFDKEGILAVIIVMSIPFIILFGLSKIFPFWAADNETNVK